MSNVASKV